MKLYIRRSGTDPNVPFEIFDGLQNLLYVVGFQGESGRQRYLMTTPEGLCVSEIARNHILMQYFTVRCRTGFYILLPHVKDYFSFRIYGSAYRFGGDLAAGRFSLFDVDKSTVMTQKKCWTRSGEGYELELFRPDDEHLALSVALCAALYIVSAEEDPVYSD